MITFGSSSKVINEWIQNYSYEYNNRMNDAVFDGCTRLSIDKLTRDRIDRYTRHNFFMVHILMTKMIMMIRYYSSHLQIIEKSRSNYYIFLNTNSWSDTH